MKPANLKSHRLRITDYLFPRTVVPDLFFHFVLGAFERLGFMAPMHAAEARALYEPFPFVSSSLCDLPSAICHLPFAIPRVHGPNACLKKAAGRRPGYPAPENNSPPPTSEEGERGRGSHLRGCNRTKVAGFPGGASNRRSSLRTSSPGRTRLLCRDPDAVYRDWTPDFGPVSQRSTLN